jgi:excisionase family DNA binding protein
MLQSTPAAAVTRGKTPVRHRKHALLASAAQCTPTPRAPRRVEAADEPVDGNDGVVLATPIEAMRMLRVSRQTLHNLVIAGSLRVRRIGRAVRIPVSEIKRLGAPGVTVTTKRKTAAPQQQAAE